MKKFFLLFTFFLSSVAYAGCAHLYPYGKQVVFHGTIELCNSFFVSIYDPNTRGVIAVFEKLSAGSPVGILTRVNAFRLDSRVSNPVKSSDYVGSGYDRGHMVPAQDASTKEQMRETFLMTNMTPQEPTLNEQSWKRLEMDVRAKFKKANKDFYITNIAIYHDPMKFISGVPVPSGYWKIVYTSNGTRYYYADNKPYAKVMEVGYVDVNLLLGN